MLVFKKSRGVRNRSRNELVEKRLGENSGCLWHAAAIEDTGCFPGNRVNGFVMWQG